MAARGHYNPSERLGGGNFNHQQSSNAEEEYDRLRNLARQEHARMSSCFDRAHQAHSAGNGAEAHELSEAGKKHQAAAENYNQQASNFIFRENNATGRVAGDTIDLHGQFVEEAEDILEARIRQARAEHQTHLHVIVGKGNHSPGHIQKIKPRVEQICRDEGLQFHTEPNEGRIFVDLTGGNINYNIPQPGHAPGKYQGGRPGYGGQQTQAGSYAAAAGGYPGQQQGGYGQQGYGQQQQQQQGGYAQQGYGQQQQPQYGGGYQQGPPPQQFQQEQQEEKPGLMTSCIKACCVVM